MEKISDQANLISYCGVYPKFTKDKVKDAKVIILSEQLDTKHVR